MQLNNVRLAFGGRGWDMYKSILANFFISTSSGAVPRYVNDGEALVGITLEDNSKSTQDFLVEQMFRRPGRTDGKLPRGCPPQSDQDPALRLRRWVKRLRGWPSFGAHRVSWFIVLLSAVPIAIVVYFSFRNTSGPVFQPGFGLDSYLKVFREVPKTITNSLVFAGASVLLIVVAGTLLGTAAIIILACFIRRLPYSVRSGASILKQIDPALEEAGINLGAPPARTFRKVTQPLMLPGILSGAILSWVMAINEVSASILLYVGRTMTLPIRVYLSVLDGYFGPASAMSTILLAVTGLSLYAVDRFFGMGREGIVG